MILTLSGSSGTGKTTIEKALIERLPNAKPLVSVTTRDPRPNDLPGDFLHVTPETFREMDARGEFLWTAAVGETRYGTQTSALREALAHPEIIWIMILVPERVPNIHAFAAEQGHAKDVRSFYILSPAEPTLRARMERRGDTPEKIEGRMHECRDFLERAKKLAVPFVWIEDRDDMEEKCARVLSAINTRSS